MVRPKEARYPYLDAVVGMGENGAKNEWNGPLDRADEISYNGALESWDVESKEVMMMALRPFRRTMVYGIAAATMLALALPGVAQQRKKIVIDTELEVEGQVQKPQVTYIVTRQDVEDEEQLDLSKSFIPKIVESVEKEPF